MKKEQKSSNVVNILVPILAGLIAFFLALFLPGVVKVTGPTSRVEVNLIGLMFGRIKYTQFGGHLSTQIYYVGSMSIFGFLSFLCLLAGIVFSILSVYFEGKKFDLIGTILITVAGLLMFLLLVGGTDIVAYIEGSKKYTYEQDFASFYNGFKLAYGAYVYAIICLFGGIFGIVNIARK